jgi:hypothetical protein
VLLLEDTMIDYERTYCCSRHAMAWACSRLSGRYPNTAKAIINVVNCKEFKDFQDFLRQIRAYLLCYQHRESLQTDIMFKALSSHCCHWIPDNELCTLIRFGSMYEDAPSRSAFMPHILLSLFTENMLGMKVLDARSRKLAELLRSTIASLFVVKGKGWELFSANIACLQSLIRFEEHSLGICACDRRTLSYCYGMDDLCALTSELQTFEFDFTIKKKRSCM